MSLDDLLESIREDEFISPKAAAGHKKKIKAEKFFNLTQEIRAEGTLGGKALTPQQRKVGFKAARGGADSVDWKNFLDQVEDTKAAASEGITSNTKMLPAGKSVLEEISTDVKSILGIIDARTEAEEDAADELKQEGEKDKRKKKEEGKEKDAKKGMKIPGFITKAAAPITNIWGQIVKTFGVLLAGWGIDKIFKWLQDPKNKKSVEELKDFITVAAPAIIKGILAYVALDIGLKVVKFAAMLAKGSLTLLGGLRNLTVTLGKWAIANPQVALAIGLGALLVGGGIVAHNQIKENRQAFDEQDDDSTLTVDEFQEDNEGITNPTEKKADISFSQGIVELGTMPGMTYNKGGTVPGSGSGDTVPAMLTPGEFVMSKGAVQKYGTSTLASMNAMGGGNNLPKRSSGVLYASGGGLVDDMAKPMIKQHEGLRLQKYTDSRGFPTIGYGHLIDKNNIIDGTITQAQADALFDMDYREHKDAAMKIPGYANANIKQKAALIDLTFNMGPGWVDGFPKFKKAFASGDYDAAANELVDSNWYGQVKTRGPVIVDLIRSKGAISGKGMGSIDKTATQLINSVPSGGRAGGGVTILPVPSGGKSGVVPSGSTSGDEPLFSPLDPDNLSTLIMKSMYSILD